MNHKITKLDGLLHQYSCLTSQNIHKFGTLTKVLIYKLEI